MGYWTYVVHILQLFFFSSIKEPGKNISMQTWVKLEIFLSKRMFQKYIFKSEQYWVLVKETKLSYRSKLLKKIEILQHVKTCILHTYFRQPNFYQFVYLISSHEYVSSKGKSCIQNREILFWHTICSFCCFLPALTVLVVTNEIKVQYIHKVIINL